MYVYTCELSILLLYCLVRLLRLLLENVSFVSWTSVYMNNTVIVLQVLKSHTSTRKTASVPAAEPGGSCTWMEVIMWRDLEQKTWTHHVFGTFQDASWVKSPLVPWQSDEIISKKNVPI